MLFPRVRYSTPLVALFAVAAFGACTVEAPISQGSSNVTEHDNTCRVPKVLFVVDASSSMLDMISTEDNVLVSKWEALGGAVHAVNEEHGRSAHYGLMTFPGSEGGCSAGEVKVDVDVMTGEAIDAVIGSTVIPSNNATPAGQTLMAAASNPDLLDPESDNYVIFISDGWQYCSVQSDGAPTCSVEGDCEAMGLDSCQSCNSCQINSSAQACSGQNADGCYCVRNWPVLGVQALAAANVKTFVVGFGDKVDARTLNQAAVAGGDPLPDCNPDSDEPSCYLKATSPAELTDTLDRIMLRVSRVPCAGGCNIAGNKRCTIEGWTDCRAPDTVKCSTECQTEGEQTCTNGVLSECSAKPCSQPGEGGSGGDGGNNTGGSSEGGNSTGGSGEGGDAEGGSGEGGHAEGGSGGSGYQPPDDEDEDPWDGRDDDYDDDDDGFFGGGGFEPDPRPLPAVGEEGGCAVSPASNNSNGTAPLALALMALGAVLRRRRES